MRVIPFTQYLRPDGRKRQVEINVSDPCGQKADEVLNDGCRFECEELTNGLVSLTIYDPSEDCDVAIQIIPNGPGMIDAVEALVDSYEK